MRGEPNGLNIDGDIGDIVSMSGKQGETRVGCITGFLSVGARRIGGISGTGGTASTVGLGGGERYGIADCKERRLAGKERGVDGGDTSINSLDLSCLSDCLFFALSCSQERAECSLFRVCGTTGADIDCILKTGRRGRYGSNGLSVNSGDDGRYMEVEQDTCSFLSIRVFIKAACEMRNQIFVCVHLSQFGIIPFGPLFSFGCAPPTFSSR